MSPAVIGGKMGDSSLESAAVKPTGAGGTETTSLASKTYKSIAKDGCCAGSETKVEFQRRMGESCLRRRLGIWLTRVQASRLGAGIGGLRRFQRTQAAHEDQLADLQTQAAGTKIAGT